MRHIPTIQTFYYTAWYAFSEGHGTSIFGNNKESKATKLQFSGTNFDYFGLPKKCQNTSEIEIEKMVKIVNAIEILKAHFV